MHTDEREIKREKRVKKVLRGCAVYAGVGLGFYILTMIVPEIADEQKAQQMKGLFTLTALSLMVYGCLMVIAFLAIRDRILIIHTIMNWFIIPSYAVWFAYEAYKALSG